MEDPSTLDLRLFKAGAEPGHSRDGSQSVAAAAHYLQKTAAGRDPVLLIIDAGALPAPDWIASSLGTLADGADLVLSSHVLATPLGRSRSRGAQSIIGVLARFHRLVVRLEDAIDPVRWDPAPRHAYETGAGLALRLSTYRAAGGLPQVPCEVARHLIARVRQSGGAVRHCPRSRIFVPPRLLCGFDSADQSSAQEMPFLVTDPDYLELGFRRRAALRAQLNRRYAELPPGERDRIVRSSLALMTPPQIVSPSGMPVEMACRRLAARLEKMSSPWRGLSGEPIRPTGLPATGHPQPF